MSRCNKYCCEMVDRIKDAASFIKSKWAKDELKELLSSAITDQESQPSTTLMHQIANASYSGEDWSKILGFLVEKLESGKGIRVNKALTIVEFLIKNGNEALIYDFKDNIRMIRDLEDFSGKGEPQIRIQSIRRKAGTIVQLINNPRMLEEERAQAENIKSKLGNNVYTNKASNSGSSSIKQVGNTKTVYEGMGSSHYSPTTYERQATNFEKVSGVASSIVKGITSKIMGNNDGLLESTSSEYRNYTSSVYPEKLQQSKTQQKPPSKLFDKLNVKKPAGITKTPSSGPSSDSKVKQSAKTERNSRNQLDVLDIIPTAYSQSHIPSIEVDLFGVNTKSGNILSQGIKQTEGIDFFTVLDPSPTPQFNSHISSTSNGMYSFGVNSGVSQPINSVANGTQGVGVSPQGLDIFQMGESPLSVKSQIRMNPVVSESKESSDPKTKYDMFQEFLF